MRRKCITNYSVLVQFFAVHFTSLTWVTVENKRATKTKTKEAQNSYAHTIARR